jgi:type IV pilus assembly protein PilC
VARFKYNAVTYEGETVNGFIEAADKMEAITQLRETCSIIKSVTDTHSIKVAVKTKHKKIPEKQLSLLCRQFAIILEAGLPIVRSTELVASQQEDKYLQSILRQVAADVSGGSTVAGSFERRAPKLPTTFIETVRAGEESGSLASSFDRLSYFFDKKGKIRQQVVSALTYPAFVMVVAVVVIIIIMVYAVPQFTNSFASMGMELPGVTKALISVSDFFTNYTIYMAAGIALIAVGLRLWKRTPKGKMALAKFALKIPVMGQIHKMNASSTFANTLAAMLSAGLPVVKALEITGNAMTNHVFATAVADSVAGVIEGRRIAAVLRDAKVLPDLLVEMTGVGEETGSMEDTLGVIGVYYDNEVTTATERATKLIEPMIICVLAGFVVFVLLAVYMPMFGMYSGM